MGPDAAGPGGVAQWVLPDVVLRSGCYLTHDHGGYQLMSPLDAQRTDGGLRPAIEVWGRVLSHPKPGLAFAWPYSGVRVPFRSYLGGTAHDR